MKSMMVIATLLISFTGLVQAGAGHELKPMHGGIIVEAKDIDVELVTKPDSLSLYLTDHGKPIPIDGGTAKLTVLIGSDKKDYELLPNGGKFELKGSFAIPKGAKAIAVIKIGTKVTTARFNL
ncbi:hypothetical protein [Polynucleobacter sp. AM-7D1]|jgi:hypothetical protein|uniref:hypothetical protein n=1 Tax=Polynucleobacter sp. AM-7D1 TaxID=2689102 RepID=UPI001BFD58B8|nr:hypothetical protein [Polynucleobacter sp. AM-7D1]QWE28464.1 hypothetical protein GQ359_08680 [Polynucleobacter sp. AM-7D1]